jgi:hypothetical protein
MEGRKETYGGRVQLPLHAVVSRKIILGHNCILWIYEETLELIPTITL